MANGVKTTAEGLAASSPKYPPLADAPPQVWTPDHVAAAENALRQLAVVDFVLRKCERCKIPHGELRADCDGLCNFFNTFLEEQRGQQAPIPTAIG